MSSANTSASMVDSLHFPLIGPLPAFSPLVAAVAILVTSIGVRVMLSNRSQIPIALSDNIASRKKRIDQYRFDSRRVLTEGYTQVLHTSTHICFSPMISPLLVQKSNFRLGHQRRYEQFDHFKAHYLRRSTRNYHGTSHPFHR